MLAQNIAHAAVLAGHHVLFTTAAQLLLDLGSQESARGLARRLNHYSQRGAVSAPSPYARALTRLPSASSASPVSLARSSTSLAHATWPASVPPRIAMR